MTEAPKKIGDILRQRPANDELLDDAQATELLGIAPGTLSVWRSTGRYDLPFLKIGRRVKYKRSTLLAWIESRTRRTTE